jgi:hypothetical protein
MGGIYEVCGWNGLKCRDILSNFHKDWYRHSKVDRGDKQHGDRISLYLFFQNKESRPKATFFFVMGLSQRKAYCLRVFEDRLFRETFETRKCKII